MSKYFIIGGKTELSKEEIDGIRQREEAVLHGMDIKSDVKSKSKLEEEDNLIHVQGRIVCKLDSDYKNFYKFQSGLVIRRERKYNEFNRRITQPVNCVVISGDGIPKNAEILVEHNALHETNRINDYKNSFELEDSDRIRYYSISTAECFAWRIDDGPWTPIESFEFALRLFVPYKGPLVGVEPKQVKDTLYVTSGEFKGKVVRTLKGCDYEIIYSEKLGVEGNLICFRPNGDGKNLEPEAIAILGAETKQVMKGELLIGYEIKNAKLLNEFIND
jgi:hypothetical protein